MPQEPHEPDARSRGQRTLGAGTDAADEKAVRRKSCWWLAVVRFDISQVGQDRAGKA